VSFALGRSRAWATRAAITAVLVVAAGCTKTPTPQPTASSGQAPAHVIGVRTVGGASEFFDARSGQRFVPRGPNFHRLSVEGGAVVDTLFAVGAYDPNWVDAQLAAVASLGFTSIRTSVDICQHHCIGSVTGGLDAQFLDNIADLLGRARRHGLQVFLTSNDLPLDGGYVSRVEATGGADFDGYTNSQYLSPVAFAVYRDYWVQTVRGLVERRAALDAVAGYELRNESFLLADKPPLSRHGGTVRTANGNAYDLSQAAARQAMVDEGLRYWLDGMRTAIRGVDPTALVGVGAFAPNEPNPWRPATDARLVAMEPIWASTLDFVDIHAYPGYLPFEQLAEDLRLTDRDPGKPVIMGEFGAFTFAFTTPAAGAAGLMAWQVASCRYGIDGWMHWHWQGTNDREVWTGTDGDNVINRALSPAERPDACTAAKLPYLATNLALGRPVVVSSALPGKPGALAVDGVALTGWESGTAPGTHLGAPRPVVGVTAVRVETVESPSFVAWYEIEVLGR
jgi:hypothetical protein